MGRAWKTYKIESQERENHFDDIRVDEGEKQRLYVNRVSVCGLDS
jgi:hypothetical protein